MIFQLNTEDFCQKYGFKRTYLKQHFDRVQELLEKQEIYVKKAKSKGEILYIVTQEYSNNWLEVGFTDFRVLKDETDLACNILITLSMIEFNAYCGKIKDFMEQLLNVKYTAYSKKTFINVIKELKARDYIMISEDKLEEGYILIGLLSKVDRELQFRKFLIDKCKELAKENNEKSYIPLFKTIVGLCILTNKKGIDNCFTYKEINSCTGLSDYQIKKSLEILKQDDAIVLGDLEYYFDIQGNLRCRGRTMSLNAFRLYDKEKPKERIVKVIIKR